MNQSDRNDNETRVSTDNHALDRDVKVAVRKMLGADADGDIRATLTVDEVAAKLGLGRDSVYAAVRANRIPHIRLGRRIVFSRAVIARMLEGVA